MINFRKTIHKSLALVHKVMAMQRKMSLCFDNKSANTEWIKSILKVVFEFMFSKMAERHFEPD